MRKRITILCVIAVMMGLVACGGPEGYYAQCGSKAADWAKNFDADSSTLKIYTETPNGAGKPVEITDADKILEIKDALDLVELGEKTEAVDDIDCYILSFAGEDGTKVNFTFRSDGAAMIGSDVYETVNTGTLFSLCGLGSTTAGAKQTASDGTSDASADDQNDTAGASAEDINERLCAYYDQALQTIIDKAGSESLLAMSHGLVDDFNGDGYAECCLAYSTDWKTVNACLMCLDPDSGAVLNQDFKVADLAGAAKVHICQGEFDGEAAFVVWYEDYDGGQFGSYLLFPIGGNELALTDQVDYQLKEDGTPVGFSLNGAQMSEEDYKEFVSGIRYELAAFSDGEANGIELGKMIPTYGGNKE